MVGAAVARNEVIEPVIFDFIKIRKERWWTSAVARNEVVEPVVL